MVGLAGNALDRYLVIHRREPLQPFDELSLIDTATGRLQGEYTHSGRLLAIEIVDLDEDGNDEVVFGGENGHRSGRGALGVLRVPFPPHAKNRKSDNGHEMAYVLFPSLKISPDEHQALVVQRIYAAEEGLLVGLGEEPFPPLLYYCLNRRLKLLRVYAPTGTFEGGRTQPWDQIEHLVASEMGPIRLWGK